MDCAVDNALRKREEDLKGQEIQDAETNLEMFQDFIDDDLVEIKILIDKAMLKARNYNDTDFREELKDMIIDLI